MADRRKDIPTVNSPNFQQKVREALSTYLGNLGDKLDRGVTVRDLVDAGLVELNAGYLVGSGGKAPIKGPAPGIGGGGSGEPVEPDLTPPPMPTGVDVTATFNNLIIEHDLPTYTQGHGHARTRVYGAQWVSGPLPTFSSAQLITEFTGTVFAHPTTLGTTWHIWLKWVSEDGVESSVPAGGTNGIARTTGKVGNSDLGPLIVEAANLANGAVSAAKLAAQAVDLTKFANGIEPVTIVTSVPGAFSTRTIVNTADWKIYRWNGTAYTKDVDGADIVAGSIVAGKIAAGAIRASEIAAGAIRAQHMLIAPKSLIVDPFFEGGSTMWNGFVQRLPSSNPAVPAGCPFPTAAQFTYRDNSWTGPPLNVQAGEQYKCSVFLNLAGGAGGGGAGLLCYFYDASNTIVNAFGFANTTAAGWQYCVATLAIPAGVVGLMIAPWTDKPVFVGNPWFTNLNVEKVNDASLIVDGSITAGKIAASAIAVGSAAIQDGAIRSALIENLAVDTAKIANGAISTAKIGDAQITAAKIADANITSAKIADGQITTAKIQDGAITNAKIGTAQVNLANINTASIGSLSVVSTTIGVLRTAPSGARVEIRDNLIQVFYWNDAEAVRISSS